MTTMKLLMLRNGARQTFKSCYYIILEESDSLDPLDMHDIVKKCSLIKARNFHFIKCFFQLKYLFCIK